ncbi:MAG: hypothetical protein A3B10_00540 [Candidatus Doudnabacteria bacterium RIFCSPLOWO2_01_FULL_44_21]|uniref:Penicillin-binding protein transpeptidase domain-containing protein n=1 Tax=Candidatus Doudnabacteria bacterium RIFCSPLOWO2_01_FULL_44_21 TaxID=1817841 RepID=A0A1F5PXP7_9BACT|nr:MAG: hypothetical protein A3B95_01195 [Candidatus Doudnabacteria bacterium RIFCSPHIGHO2_02_FULL_43_13b]OGE94627.1 MAG: hypothetical protein A3B10_00540 [Candidatus Doudnabacteria bacterium RIFCSPLOWO2_01_FULL_44_21]
MNRLSSLTSNGKNTNSYNLRIFLLLSAILIFLGLIGLRLFILQVLNHSYYEALSDNQHGSETTLLAKRGEIYLTEAKSDSAVLVATNITKNLVYANQKVITDPDNTAARLAPLLEMSKFDVALKLSGDSSYTILKKQLSDEISAQILALKIPGIYLEPEEIRFYPQKSLASQVIGFLGFQGDQRLGQYGIEGKFEKQLAGSSGIQGIEKDAAGRWITFVDRLFVPSQDGDDIYLTLDPAIQFNAQEALKKSVETHQADSGSVVVINPKTGAILAMASFPDFDPNSYNKVDDISVYSNLTLSLDYEPGSVFKPITMAAALNEGKVTPETTYEDLGVVQVDDKQIKNSDGEAHGTQNMTQVLEQSLNTGAIFAEQQVGNKTFKEYVKKFGFGKSVEMALPGQVAGNLDNLNKRGDVFFATAAFGQGITVTPIQLIQAFTAIANGGKMVKPYIINKIVHPDQTEEITDKAKETQVIDSKTAATLSAMLVNVVENGHGKRAAVGGYYLAGKTGTAQVAYKDRVGYDPNRNIGTFIGFGPVDNPQFLMLVRIDNPKDVKFAESTAAPTFGQIAEFILNYLQIPPSR